MSLFKKKGDSKPATPKAKKAPAKPLFGKKTTNPTPVAENLSSKPPVKTAKPTFSFGNKAPKPSKQPIDTKKLIPILTGVLVLILLAVMAKLFLFKDEPTAIEATPPVVAETSAESAPQEPINNTEPNSEMATEAEVDLADTTATENTQPTDAPAQEASNAQTPSVPTDAITTNEHITYEEFVKEAEKRIYRERDTGSRTNQ